MSSASDAAERYAAWAKAGSTDYNARAFEQPAISGEHWNASIPQGFQSTAGSGGGGGGGGGGTPQVTAQPFGTNSDKLTPIAVPAAQAGQRASIAGEDQNSISARFKALTDDPRGVVDQVLKALGIDMDSAGPYAKYMRNQAGLIKPAYYLSQQGSTDATRMKPNEYIDFAKNFLTTMGGNINGGDRQGAVRDALGMNPGKQSEGWATMLNSPDYTDEQRQDMMNALYGVGAMGSTDPFTRYRAENVGRMGQRFGGEYGAGTQGLNPLFMDYIRSMMPELSGW